MSTTTIEIFTTDCPLCEAAVQTVRTLACDDCDIIVHDLREEEGAQRAAELAVRSVPAVAVDGRLADCCAGRGIDEASLHAAGIGRRD